MRTLALTLILTISLMVFTGSVLAATTAQVTPGDPAPPAEEEPSPLAQTLGVVLVLVVGGLAGFLILRRSKAREQSATAAVQQASRLSREDREDATRRVEKSAGREDSYEQVFVYDELSRNFHTYLAAYELIVRGLQVRLYSEPPNADFNFGNKKMRRMDLTKAKSFTTESLAPHLMGMTSIAQFSKLVPYRRRDRLALVVHVDDLDDAYELFLDLGIRRVGTPAPADDPQGL